MRGILPLCVFGLLLTPDTGQAQRLSQLAPGTLVKITTHQGATIIGPLAEVRADTVVVSSTVQQPGTSIPLAGIATASYADGTESGSAKRGALIGAGLGFALALLIGRDETDEWRLFSSTPVRVVMTALGGIIGLRLGAADASPHWVDTAIAAAGGQPQPARSFVGLALRF